LPRRTTVFPVPEPGQPAHEMSVRVALRDMDSVNIYYSSYYEWMERALAEFLDRAGHPISGIFDGGRAIPVVHSECSYLAPVRLDDRLRLRSWVAALGRTSFTMAHVFTREADEMRVALGRVTHVWVERAEMRSIPVPDWFRATAGTRCEGPVTDGSGA
jgi:YbgC/YbaW family acyl-CoA thioester hydrolase